VVHDTLAREIGVFDLQSPAGASTDSKCIAFLLNCPTLEALDFIELSFRVMNNLYNLVDYSFYRSVEQSEQEAIEELNHRFREHGVGYQFEDDEILRVDSQYVHAEVVKPAIALLNTAGFEGALDEFLKAHEHYRKGRHGEAMIEALKAFESTMKAICDENGDLQHEERHRKRPHQGRARQRASSQVHGVAPRGTPQHPAGRSADR
jgi:hypothetical protein